METGMVQSQSQGKVGEYRIIGQLGKGSFGMVYRVKQSIPDRQNISQKAQEPKEKENSQSKVITAKTSASQEQTFAVKVVAYRSQEYLTNIKPMLEIEYKILQQLWRAGTDHDTLNIKVRSLSSQEMSVCEAQGEFARKIKQQLIDLNSKQEMNLPFPRIHDYGQLETYSYLVMQQLGVTLEQKVKSINKPLTLITVLQIMSATLWSIQLVHQAGYLHRDIKPGNFMVRSSAPAKKQDRDSLASDSLVLMDFGLGKRYLRKSGGQAEHHIPYKEGKKITGTPIYCSRNTHLGIQQSRRDDLQCWVHTILHIIKRLPWEDPAITNQKDKEVQNQKIKQLKLKTSIPQLILKGGNQQHSYPACLKEIHNYVSFLEFTQEPNYDYLQQMIADNARKIGIRLSTRGKSEIRIDWDAKLTENNDRFSPEKGKNIKIKFSIGNRNLKQLPKVELQNLDKQKMFEQIVNKAKPGK